MNPVYMFGLTYDYIHKHVNIDLGGGYYTADGGDLYYMSGVNKMGSIDNQQKELYFLGYTAHDQFTVNEDNGNGGTENNTYDADRLDVKYQRYSILAQPKVVLTMPVKEKFFFSIEVGYMVQVFQHCVVKFDQVHGSHSYTVGHINQGNNGMLNGPSASIGFGMSL